MKQFYIYYFFKFLRTNNAFNAYVNNCRRYSANKGILDCLNSINVEQFIVYPFSWRLTFEGSAYWYKLHSSWLNFYLPIYNYRFK